MSEKTCRKCGHTTTYAPTSLEPQSCMECGAIYRKVEEAFQRASEGRPSQLPGASVFSRVAATVPILRCCAARACTRPGASW